MGHKQKLGTAEKMELVRDYPSGKISLREAARRACAANASVKQWVDNYEVYPGTPFDGFQGFGNLFVRHIAHICPICSAASVRSFPRVGRGMGQNQCAEFPHKYTAANKEYSCPSSSHILRC